MEIFPEDVSLFQSSGILHYDRDNNGKYKLIVEIDRDITNYYRSFIPKHLYIQPQKYKPHISVVRKESKVINRYWQKYEGRVVNFHYTNFIRYNELYYWIDVFSLELERIRTQLGLELFSSFIEPPKRFTHCFHCTLGNTK